MGRVRRIVSWNSSTESLPEAIAFYRDLLGATVESGPSIERRSDGTEVAIARLRIGELSLGIFQWPGGRRPDWDHHTFEVEWPGEADAVRGRLESEGVAVEGVRGHRDDAGYSIVLRDPGGNRVELSTSGAAGSSGASS